MPAPTQSYAAFAADKPLGPFDFERRDPRPDDVCIDILYCGVCHSDLHTARNDWGGSRYPIVPGHEIVGRVSAVGGEVTKYKQGDLVGVGCMVDSCRTCEACADGLEQYCDAGATMTYGGKDRIDGQFTQGGYSDKIVVSERFVLRMPDNIELQSAAPLLCAGITTYSPLRHFGVGSRHRIGIIGMGGLGHMGIKLAKAMGAEVTLFTRSEHKVDEAKRNGADHVIISTDREQMREAAGSLHFVLDTAPVQHDINPYLKTLRHDGTHILVGLLEPMEPALQSKELVFKRRVLAGSLIGGIPETQEMLDFCAQHDISCDIEMINIDQINQAYERLIKSDVKYRFVIDMASLKNNAAA